MNSMITFLPHIEYAFEKINENIIFSNRLSKNILIDILE